MRVPVVRSSLRAPKKKAKTSKQVETAGRGGSFFDKFLHTQKQRTLASADFGQGLMAAAATVRSAGGRATRGKELEPWLVDAPNTVCRERQARCAAALLNAVVDRRSQLLSVPGSHSLLAHVHVWLCVTDAALE